MPFPSLGDMAGGLLRALGAGTVLNRSNGFWRARAAAGLPISARFRLQAFATPPAPAASLPSAGPLT